ncbi:hypothetical protein PHAVU_007G182000 [Phaseolus vulgaris]|uniref:Uncharacterized protein n=1 Tax=Phaseolus vulgaris TaxID=3885 RepID=V7BFU5_PHAVU|nr:hypothetical protein PHAVU_007G182000g [Phaseolus vulgaris]ESW16749.1 hypothetical protein PHAVU_007G182000g [Phaseolus vulgaris]
MQMINGPMRVYYVQCRIPSNNIDSWNTFQFYKDFLNYFNYLTSKHFQYVFPLNYQYHQPTKLAKSCRFAEKVTEK